MKTEMVGKTGVLIVPILLVAASAAGQVPSSLGSSAAPSTQGASSGDRMEQRDPKSPISGIADGRGPNGPVSLKILRPGPDEEIPLTGGATNGAEVHVTLDLKNYPTFFDAVTKSGQGLALFLDGLPYFMDYDVSKPWVFRRVSPGIHTLKAVPIRPWGEPIREKDAFGMVSFRVGPKSDKVAPVAEGPVLMVFTPKVGAKYAGAGAPSLRFDFLVRGCRVSEDRGADTCRVRYRIDDHPEVILTKTDSVPIVGLTPGRHGLSVGLTRDGKLIAGAFTLVQTSFEVTDIAR